MKKNLGWMFAALLVTAIACDDDDNKDRASTYDRDFLRNAAYANLAKIEAGRVAEDRASDPEVEHFGTHMLQDHTTAWNELAAVAKDENVNLPDEPDAAHQAKLQYLMTLTGYQFDTAYVNSQIKDHQLAITLFTQAKADADDDDVRDYATKYLPHLQDHLTDALALQAALADQP